MPTVLATDAERSANEDLRAAVARIHAGTPVDDAFWIRLTREIRRRGTAAVLAASRQSGAGRLEDEDAAGYVLLALQLEPVQERIIVDAVTPWAVLADAAVRVWREAARSLHAPARYGNLRPRALEELPPGDRDAFSVTQLDPERAESDGRVFRAEQRLIDLLLQRVSLAPLHAPIRRAAAFIVSDPVSSSHEADLEQRLAADVPELTPRQIRAVIEVTLGMRGRRPTTSVLGALLKDPAFDPRRSPVHAAALRRFERVLS